MSIKMDKRKFYGIAAIFILWSPFWLIFKDLAGPIFSYFGMGMFIAMGLFAILAYKQNLLEINGKDITHSVGNSSETVSNLAEINYRLYLKMNHSSGNSAKHLDIKFIDKNGKYIEVSYFAFRREQIREFVNLCLQTHPDCKVTKTLDSKFLTSDDIDKYL